MAGAVVAPCGGSREEVDLEIARRPMESSQARRVQSLDDAASWTRQTRVRVDEGVHCSIEGNRCVLNDTLTPDELDLH